VKPICISPLAQRIALAVVGAAVAVAIASEAPDMRRYLKMERM
jgi:hypothetical protein